MLLNENDQEFIETRPLEIEESGLPRQGLTMDLEKFSLQLPLVMQIGMNNSTATGMLGGFNEVMHIPDTQKKKKKTPFPPSPREGGQVRE